MASQKLNGAVLLIGSLAWENEQNAIDPNVGKLRDNWRRDNLKMEKAISVKAPIRYGRKSSSRKNTFTMVFSESIPVEGSALLVPFKLQVDSADNFKTVFEEALKLAEAEGINKNDGNLYKSWGTVALKVTDSFFQKHSELAEELKKKWGEYFNGIIKDQDYRVSETSCVTSNSLANFNINGENSFDFFLCTAIRPERSVYPTAKEIANQMQLSGYFTYFKENIKNGIITFQDEEIMSYLFAEEKKNINYPLKKIDFADYSDNLGGLEQLYKDIKVRLGDSIFTPSLSMLCHLVLKELVYSYTVQARFKDEEVEAGCNYAMDKFEERFGYRDPDTHSRLNRHVLSDFLALICYFQEAPGKVLERLKSSVLDDLNRVNQTITSYEKQIFIQTSNKDLIAPRNHNERTIFDFYRRNLKERQAILDYFFNGISERAIYKARVNDLLGIGLNIFDWYYDRPYGLSIPKSERLFDHNKIDTYSHRLMEVPISQSQKFKVLFVEDKPQFYIDLQKYITFEQAFHNCKYYISILPKEHSNRKELFLEMEELFKQKKWFGFYGLALGQIEGLFHEMAVSINLKSKLGSLPDKVQAVRSDSEYDPHLDYYQYHIPNQRNKFMHSGTDSDLELKSYDVLYDLNYLLGIFAGLKTPYIEANTIIVHRDPMKFINVEDFSSFFDLLERTHKSGHFGKIETSYAEFQKNFLCAEIDIDYLIHETPARLKEALDRLFEASLAFTSVNSQPIDLRIIKKSVIVKQPDKYRDSIRAFYDSYTEMFENVLAFNSFFKFYKKYLPSLSAELQKKINDLRNEHQDNLEGIEAINRLFEV